MAADLDPQAKYHSIQLLNGQRWGNDNTLDEANKVYMMPVEQWEPIKQNPQQMIDIIQYFVQHHYEKQLPRIIELERYYKGDNDIHYANTHKGSNRADNRVTSGFPKYITDIKVGHAVGNPLKFQYSNDDNEDKDLIQAVQDFNERNDESYHEKIMKKNLSVTGRAFELEYVKEGTTDVMLRAIDPTNAFVVYDTDIEQHSLFAIRYYLVDFNNTKEYHIEVYTDDKVYYFTAGESPSLDIKFISQQDHFFNAVPLTEFINNSERMGDWEASLDKIDAIDKSLSEMANSQEDFSNAMLHIDGDFNLADENGNLITNGKSNKPVINPQARIIFTKPSIINDGLSTNSTVIPSNIGYLVKDTNVTDWKTYVDLLAAQIHKDTNTPDTSDQNFAGNVSGEAMSYKLWGQDQTRATQQSLFTRGIMRRLRLLANYLTAKGTLSNKDNIENFNIVYTPNLPKNDNETIQKISGLNTTGKFSDETIRELAETITGINAKTEEQRVDEQDKKDLEQDPIQQQFPRKPLIQTVDGSPLNRDYQRLKQNSRENDVNMINAVRLGEANGKTRSSTNH